MSEPESRYYYSQRLRLHYVAWGNQGRPPLVLIHGGRDHCRNWDPVALALQDRYTVYAPDLRGHGDSGWALGGMYSLPEFVLDTATLAASLGDGPLTIIGHSLGGAVAPDGVVQLQPLRVVVAGLRFAHCFCAIILYNDP